MTEQPASEKGLIMPTTMDSMEVETDTATTISAKMLRERSRSAIPIKFLRPLFLLMDQ
jgi:hypothetical protein